MGQNDKSTGYAKTCQSIIYIKGIQNTINNVKTDYSELASEKNIVSTKANFSTFLTYLRNIFIGSASKANTIDKLNSSDNIKLTDWQATHIQAENLYLVPIDAIEKEIHAHDKISVHDVAQEINIYDEVYCAIDEKEIHIYEEIPNDVSNVKINDRISEKNLDLTMNNTLSDLEKLIFTKVK
ncbi:MAG: hypothetical protein AB8W37_12625 [Arsenophonus endosymbiont of Dermacentor nuttalli]